MKLQKNIRIILAAVGANLDRTDLEHIEGKTYSSNNAIIKELESNPETTKILTAEEFLKELPFTQMRKPFLLAMENNRRKKQCYKLTDFMDDFNNQEFGAETDKFWFGVVKMK